MNATAPSAADMVVQKLDAWLMHASVCQLEPCPTCDALFNQLRLAHAVWFNTRGENRKATS